MTLLLAPTPTVRQTLEAVFQLIVANAPGSGTPTGQRVQVAQAAESLLERLIEGRIREALAKHIAAEAEAFDGRVYTVLKEALAAAPKGEVEDSGD